MQNTEHNILGRVIDAPLSSHTDETASVNAALRCVTCGKPAERKFCGSACYTAWRRGRPFEPRFWAKVHKTPTCWLWTSSRIPGWHGQFFVGGRPQYAHRIAWELANGPIPAGVQVLHTCDVPHCVNPAHLFLGSQDDNLKDASRKGRLCVPRPRRRKLTDEQIAEMFELRKQGLTVVVIAERLGVSKGFVSLALNGKRRVYNAPLAKASGF